MARNWKSFHIMMVKIMKIKIVQTINDIFTFFVPVLMPVLLLIVVFVFALLGTEIFYNDLRCG